MIIAIGNDHAGVALKNSIKEHLINKGYEVLDLGIQEGDTVRLYGLSFDYYK